ncbi:hypothetical protein NDU88_001467 [Pleurodeles waltl]|uniref:Uncharacterized protein n=1 Tax=Pleurodeles waltl TaxID=8319 RepID=A0AAV7U8K3_PLEWA|nr:hypothetical protein NDU88_001467 [Pleurodeles waltl]
MSTLSACAHGAINLLASVTYWRRPSLRETDAPPRPTAAVGSSWKEPLTEAQRLKSGGFSPFETTVGAPECAPAASPEHCDVVVGRTLKSGQAGNHS